MHKTFGYRACGLKRAGMALAVCACFCFPAAVCGASDVEVTGIVLEKNGESVAIVNGAVVKVGDKLGDIEIVAIGADAVTVREGGQNRVKKLEDAAAPAEDAAVHAPADVVAGVYGERDAIGPKAVASLTMSLFYDNGAVAGYIVFRDAKGEMRAVDFAEPAYADIHKLLSVDRGQARYSGQRDKRVDIGRIVPSDFKYFRTKDGQVLLAYVLKPFYYQLGASKRALVVFNWGRMQVQCEMGDVTQ